MNKIKPFNNVVFRQPVYDLHFYVDTMSSPASLRAVLESEDFKLALLASSPELFIEFSKWLDGTLNPSKAKRMQNTAVKYFERMCTRCTPFGRFSYCSLGSIGSATKISNHQEKRPTLLYDYNLSGQLCALINKDSDRKIYVNPTIYKIADKFHFQIKSGNDEIKEIQVRATDLMQKVLDLTGREISITDIVKQLQVEYDIDFATCSSYLNQLTNLGLLIPFVTPQTICSERENFSLTTSGEGSSDLLGKIASDFNELEEAITAESYYCILNNIHSALKDNQLSIDLKTIVQTDSYSDSKQNSISEKAINELIDYNRLLSSVTPRYASPAMSKFKKDYMDRYEGEKRPLLEVLNSESGIGYGSSSSPKKEAFLKCITQQSNKKVQNFSLTPFQILLLNKILTENMSRHRLELTRQDFAKCALNENTKMGLSFAAMCKLFSLGDDTIICHPTFNGGSAANLLARFASGDNAVSHLVAEILSYEDSQSDSLLCEISYLPSLRSGNVLRRMPLRKNYINYMCKSTGSATEIPLNDICIQIINGRIVLSSMKTGKRIEPRLTSAYNYPKSLSTVFRFLCDYQYLNYRAGLSFNWGALNTLLNHFPRVKFGSIVMVPERWRVNCDSFLCSGQFSMTKFSDYCDSQQIPTWFNLSEGDNTLLVDLNNPLSIDAFLSAVKNKKSFEIEEFIPADNYQSCDSIAECIIPLKYTL